MQLINTTNGIVVADCVKLAVNFFKRLRGLIGSPGLKSSEALIIQPCNAVHTYFMQYPIDVVFLDKEWHVLQVMENMQPYRLSPIVAGAYVAVELAAGRIATTSTFVGHRLKLEAKEAQL